MYILNAHKLDFFANEKNIYKYYIYYVYNTQLSLPVYVYHARLYVVGKRLCYICKIKVNNFSTLLIKT